jgi:hypothetical protein
MKGAVGARSSPEQWPRWWTCDDKEGEKWLLAEIEVGEGFLKLYRQKGGKRNRFGHFVDEEEHDREERTIDGGWHPRDPRWTVKETTDDGDSWSKTTT